MPRIPFCSADLSDRDIEHMIETAKIARSEFLRVNSRHVFRGVGWSALACGLAFLVVVGAGSARHQVLENTGRIERLATTLEQIERIKPDTLREVAQLLRRADYDCRQIACDAWLEKRNVAARGRLEMIMARHSFPATVAAKQ